MHDSLQFILESPQDNLNARKRPRLVTSCDNWYVTLIDERHKIHASNWYFTVVSRKSNAFKLRQMRNARHATKRRFHAGSGTGKDTLLNEVNSLGVPLHRQHVAATSKIGLRTINHGTI